MLIFRIFLTLHCEQRWTFLVIAGRLIFSRKSLWSETVRIASIPAPAVRYLIGFRVFCMVAHHFLKPFPGIAVTETHTWAAAHREMMQRSKHSPDPRSSHSSPGSPSGSIVVSSGMKVFVRILPVGLPHIPVGSQHVGRSCKNHVVNARKCNYGLIHSDKCHKGQAADLDQTASWNGTAAGRSLPQGEPEQSLPEVSSLLQMSGKDNKTVACTCFFLEMFKKYTGNYYFTDILRRLEESISMFSLCAVLIVGALCWVPFCGELDFLIYLVLCPYKELPEESAKDREGFPVWEDSMFASTLSEL